MSIEAPMSKYKRTNFKIGLAACIIFAAWFGYDGYLSKYEWSHRRNFYEKHAPEGKPDDTMIFNRIAPMFLVIAGAFLTIRFLAAKDKKLLADENELIVHDKKRIPYDSIQKIDKTHFSSKGYFVITYKDTDGNEVDRKLSDRKYDNLAAILDHLVAKIS